MGNLAVGGTFGSATLLDQVNAFVARALPQELVGEIFKTQDGLDQAREVARTSPTIHRWVAIASKANEAGDREGISHAKSVLDQEVTMINFKVLGVPGNPFAPVETFEDKLARYDEADLTDRSIQMLQDRSAPALV